MKINLSRIIHIVVLFIFLYNPPLLKNSVLIHVLFIVSVVKIANSRKEHKRAYNIMQNTKILPFIGSLIFISAYLLVYDSISRNANVAYGRIYLYMIIAVEIVIISYRIGIFYESKGLEYACNDILIAGNIQALIGVLMFVSPALKQTLVNIMYSNGVSKISPYLLRARFFGFANYLTSTTAILQIMLAVLAFWLFLDKSYKYIFYFPMLVFSAIFNARSSLVIGVVGILLVLFYKIRIENKKAFRKILIIILLSTLVICFIMPRIANGASVEWVQDGIEEIVAFLQGEETGYFEYLNEKIFLPESFREVLFGTGHAIFLGRIASDVGYINDIWMIGIILTFGLYLSYIIFLKNNYKTSDKMGKCMRIFFICTFLIYNIKGIVINNNEIITFTILYIFIEYFTKPCGEIRGKK